MAMSLIPNVGFWMGAQIITIQETNGIGVHWDNLDQRVYPTDEFTMSHVMWMCGAGMAFCLGITWYFDAIWPGKYGVAKKYYFPFQVIVLQNNNSQCFGHKL